MRISSTPASNGKRTRRGHAPETFNGREPGQDSSPPAAPPELRESPPAPADDAPVDHSALLNGTAIGLGAFAIFIAFVALISQIAGSGSADDMSPRRTATGAAAAPAVAPSATATSSAASDAKVKFEPYQRPDPALPAIPAGDVKSFKVDVFEHVTKVSDDLPATRVWSYAVNGTAYRGTGASTPIVVNQGDKVHMELINGGSKKMDVQMPHSIDFHSSEIAPNAAFITVGPGKTHSFDFTAGHPGVYMYHCATDPVLQHTGEGMVGMMIVKPKNLAPAKEFWMTQQEFYVGEPGKLGDFEAMKAKNPNAITFNGYALQYKKEPISVAVGERVRIYVLNAGPSIWSAFHVIGTVFDKTVIEGTTGRHVQTVNLAPSQGGYVEFTLAEDGKYPFVTHAFGDAVKGAIGVLKAGDGGPADKGH